MQTVYEHIWYGHGQKSKILDATLSTWREREREREAQRISCWKHVEVISTRMHDRLCEVTPLDNDDKFRGPSRIKAVPCLVSVHMKKLSKLETKF